MRLTAALDPALADRVARWAQASGWQHDTPWLAAWLVVQRAWAGDGALAVQDLALGAEAARLLSLAADEPTAHAVARLDRERRQPPGASAAAMAPALVWCGLTEGEPATTTTQEPAWVAGVQRIPRPDGASTGWWADADPAWQGPFEVLAPALTQAVQGLMDAPHAPVATIDPLPPRWRRAWLHDWNPPPADPPPGRTVVTQFRACAARHADAPALCWAGGSLSYRALDAQSDALARALVRQGIQPGDAVGLSLPRGPQAMRAVLGILKAGACYVPIDTAYPEARRAFMAADAGLRWVIGGEPYAASAARHLGLDELCRLGERAAAALPEPDDQAVAYVMYTSGSTGEPKGIEVTHGNILRLVSPAHFMRLDAGVRMLLAAPLGFDASTLELWGPLLNGGTCVLHDEELPSPAGLQATIERLGADTAWLTAALFNAVVDDTPQRLRGLRQLLIGGEALSVAHVRRAQSALPGLQLINGYGPTECTTFVATHPIEPELPADAVSVPIGRPIQDTQLVVLGPLGHLLPPGVAGELHAGGRGLARGYRGRPDLTAERFVQRDLGIGPQRLYRTGDLVRAREDGTLEFLGRLDAQVKIRGHRIEPGEVEAVLAAHPAVQACAVVPVRGDDGDMALVAYVVCRGEAGIGTLRDYLAERLPAYLCPSHLVPLDALPRTANGKLDRRALPSPATGRPTLRVPCEPPADALEAGLCEVFAEVLGVRPVGRLDSFFDLGGHSLRVLKALAAIARRGLGSLPAAAFYHQPTPQGLARALRAPQAPALANSRLPRAPSARATGAEPIALIGMAGRFPGAGDVESFWQLLCEGREGITDFEPGTLDASLAPSLLADPAYVAARGVIDGIEDFDPGFFGLTPREAELMDPQHRVFLEVCWECLERAGHAPDAAQRPVGVFAGMYNATYFQRHLQHRPDLIARVGEFATMLGNEKDYLVTRVAHRLNLQGPAVSVHTACSTSLVAIAQAVASLRAGQCDMALAGGVAVTCPPRSGHLHQEGAMLSPDGRTRSFDARAQGTVFSDGAAVVLLKRLSDAQADGDNVVALIRAVAVNNDGRDKASFTAPSVDGQAAVIAQALAAADVDSRSIGYVEAHGTATPLGDPVEVEALTRAFRRHTADTGFCRLGSLKSNVGHMVTAAGAAGVIKAALALQRQVLPPSIHYEQPNPQIDLAASPFRVVSALEAWPRGTVPRRAGVSSFGVGGTNAHAVLEEAPPALPSPAAVGAQCLRLSAHSAPALGRAAQALAAHLAAEPGLNLADVAHTLDVGRSRFGHRLAVAAGSTADAVQALREADARWRSAREVPPQRPPVVWVFPGQGSQYAGMGRGLHAADPHFRAAFDEAVAAMAAAGLPGLKARLFQATAAELADTALAQPALFCLEVALAAAFRQRFGTPSALIGHSVGEFAAAVEAGVMSLADAARLVARRGALMQAQPPGGMLAVRLPREEVLARLPAALSLAAENAPRACVVSGPSEAVADWQQALQAEGVPCRALDTSHAFHSPMMDAAARDFAQDVRRVALQAPRLPIASTLTGTWMRPEDATDPDYWARHLREPVQFSAAVRTVFAGPAAVFVELGPRAALGALVRQQAAPGAAPIAALATLADNPGDEALAWQSAAGAMWTLGHESAVPLAGPAAGRHRLPLPTTPFDRRRCWVEAQAPQPAASPTAAPPAPPLAGLAAPVSPVDPPPAMNATANPPNGARRERLVRELRALFEDIAGTDLSGLNPRTGFLEMGLDSLTLTRAAIQVKSGFKVNVSFRQLMSELRSLDALAAHLDAQLPPEAAVLAAAAPPAPLEAAPSAPAWSGTAAAVTGTPDLVQQVIQQQMQLMAQQLALLRGAPLAAAPAAALPSATTAPPTTPSSTPATPTASEDAPVRYDVKKAFGAIARIHTQAAELTERQQARLDAFMRRYVDRTRKSREFTRLHRPHLADPRVVNGFRPMTKEITYQIVIERSKGSRVWDLDGHEYVDVLNGFGMNLFGWQPEFVQAAVKAQLEAGYEIGPQHPLAGEVAQLVCELTGFDRAGLCNTGSEAVMAAVRIARTVTGRRTVVLFSGSYHGTFDEVVVRAGRGGKGIPGAPGLMPGVYGDVRVLDYGTPESLAWIRANAGDLAAVLVEPVQSRRPDFQPRDFLHELRELTQASSTCLIFDEVITGFRAHLGGTQAMFGLRADLACYGKVIGGGFPLGVVAGRRDYMDALDGGAWDYGDDSIPTVGVTYFAGTFVRHPLALAAARASLRHLKAAGPALQTQLNLHTAALADELNAYCRDAGAPIEIRHFGSLWRVTWLEDHPLQDLLFAMMRSRGVHILDNFPCFLTTAHTPDDIAAIKSAFRESVAELQEAGFLPQRARREDMFDAAHPPVPQARLGRDKDGRAAWFVPKDGAPGKFVKLQG